MEKLHAEHGDRIRRYLARLVGPADADDLAQDVFEKVQGAIATYRGESRLLTWLYRIATNVAIDRLRSVERRTGLERDADGAAQIEADGVADGTHELKARLEGACTFHRDERNELACAPKVGGIVSLARSR